jgi:hypothetical protein
MYRNTIEIELKNIEPRLVLVPRKVVDKVVLHQRKLPAILGLISSQFSSIDSIWTDFETINSLSQELEFELEIGSLPFGKILLLAKVEGEMPGKFSIEERNTLYWRRLFHAEVKLKFIELKEKGLLSEAVIEKKIKTIGRTIFSEALMVLEQEHKVFSEQDIADKYISFAASFAELYRFSENLLANYFPSIKDYESLLLIIRNDVAEDIIFQETRIPGTQNPHPTPETHAEESSEYFKRLSEQAEKESSLNNATVSAILWTQANRVAPAELSPNTIEKAHKEIRKLVKRLQAALNFNSSDFQNWESALLPLLDKADQGSSPVEARLLTELQSACEDYEQEIYRIDIFSWAISFGKKPMKRPLRFQRLIKIHQRLREASLNAITTRLAFADRKKLETLLQLVWKQNEKLLRDEIRPIIENNLQSVGLKSEGAFGEIARRRLVEEFLDRIIEQGYLNYSELRDMISRNHLKLEDIRDAASFFKGDALLALDENLSLQLDGVYRRSDFYLRWLEKSTALNFGTATGRTLTKFLTLPFGGSFLLIESADLISDKISGDRIPDLIRTLTFITLGLFFFGVINNHSFRTFVLDCLLIFWKTAKFIFYKIPSTLLTWNPFLLIWKSLPVQIIYSLILKPLLFTEAIALWLPKSYPYHVGEIVLFIGFTLLLNSRPGRLLSEFAISSMLTLGKLIQDGLISILFTIMVQSFKKTIEGLEFVLQWVNDWLRLRGRAKPWQMALRGFLGLLWSPVAFFLRFYTVVLIEPGINPIKFPISSVAAKFTYPIIIPLTPEIVHFFSPFIGDVLSNLFFGTTIWLTPNLFGFLFWETKENWGLYRANRPQSLRPMAIGTHGETIPQLLKIGFHSGTIPKLFMKLRKAEQDAVTRSDWRKARTLRLDLQTIKERLARFIERDLLIPMQQNNKSFIRPLRVSEISLGINRIEAEMTGMDDNGYASFKISLELIDGMLMGSVSKPGGTLALNEQQNRCLSLGIAGLYKFAGIEISKEQISSNLPSWVTDWKIYEGNLVLFSEKQSTILVPIKNGDSQPRLQINRSENSCNLETLDFERLLFSRQPLTWQDWSDGWDRSANNLYVWPLYYAGVEPDIVGNAPNKIPFDTIERWQETTEISDLNQGYKSV